MSFFLINVYIRVTSQFLDLNVVKGMIFHETNCHKQKKKHWLNFNLVEPLLKTHHTAQKMKFSIKDFFSKCDEIPRKMWIWPHLLKKSFMENLFFCTVSFRNEMEIYSRKFQGFVLNWFNEYALVLTIWWLSRYSIPLKA